MVPIDTRDVDDLRACAVGTYLPAQPLPARATGIFGDSAPPGSAAYAAADAAAISPKLAPPPEPIPGWCRSGSLWPNERYVVRIPRRWNGNLVVAGTPASRSEFACDRIWSDPLVARGYAYACGNKSLGDGAHLLADGVQLEIDGLTMPRFGLRNGLALAFWQHAPGSTLESWMREFFAITEVARETCGALHGRQPERTYAIGLSNGGVQVRYALERSDLYAGGVAWNAPLWSVEHNLLRHLPEAVEAMATGRLERLEPLGFPPDVLGISGASLYERNLNIYWAVTAWLYAMLFDPEASIPYGDVRDPRPAESWAGRIGSWHADRAPQIAERIAAYAHTGALRAPLIDLASEYDHLVPPAMHFHPYGALVAAAGKSMLYRSDLIADAQHVDAWSEEPDFPSLRPGYRRAIAAFDELIRWVEG